MVLVEHATGTEIMKSYGMTMDMFTPWTRSVPLATAKEEFTSTKSSVYPELENENYVY